jgi:P4 family phage/plasmid primase-like protien
MEIKFEKYLSILHDTIKESFYSKSRKKGEFYNGKSVYKEDSYPDLVFNYLTNYMKCDTKGLPKKAHINCDYVFALILNELNNFNELYSNFKIGVDNYINNKDVYIYNGMIWNKLTFEECDKLFKTLLDAVNSEIIYKQKLLKLLRDGINQLELKKPPFDRTKMALQNGVFDFKKMILYPLPNFKGVKEYRADGTDMPYLKNLSYGLTIQHNYDHIEYSEHLFNISKFKQYLDDVLKEGEDNSKIMVLQEFLGWAICRLPHKIEQMLFLVGEGSNGKSVLFELMYEILGEENMSTVPLNKLLKDEDKHSHLLESKIINYCSEIGQFNRSTDLEKFKRLASGEPIEIKRNYKDIYTVDEYARIIVNGNRLPPIQEASEAWFRRLLILNFDKTFKGANKNVNLKDEIVAEGLGLILAWICEGAKRLNERLNNPNNKEGTFYPCTHVIKNLQLYKSQYSSMLYFVSVCLKPCDKYNAKEDFNAGSQPLLISFLYNKYKEFCIRRNLNVIHDVRQLDKSIKDSGIAIERNDIQEIISIRADFDANGEFK